MHNGQCHGCSEVRCRWRLSKCSRPVLPAATHSTATRPHLGMVRLQPPPLGCRQGERVSSPGKQQCVRSWSHAPSLPHDQHTQARLAHHSAAGRWPLSTHLHSRLPAALPPSPAQQTAPPPRWGCTCLRAEGRQASLECSGQGHMTDNLGLSTGRRQSLPNLSTCPISIRALGEVFLALPLLPCRLLPCNL